MPRFVAFLRAINLGSSHTVKMDALRQVFESLGFSKTATFLASGNIIFESTAKNARTLERKIEKRLLETLGYEVPTFIRTDVELREIANYWPFRESEIDAAAEFNIIFLADPLDEMTEQKVMALNRQSDDKLHVHGREIYWLRRRMQGGPAGSLQKIMDMPFTFRSSQTVRKIAEKYASPKP